MAKQPQFGISLGVVNFSIILFFNIFFNILYKCPDIFSSLFSYEKQARTSKTILQATVQMSPSISDVIGRI